MTKTKELDPMRQVSQSSQSISYRFFLQAYLLIFSTEVLFALINPSYVQLFFDEKSPFWFSIDSQQQAGIYYGLFLLTGQIAGIIANVLWGLVSDYIGRKKVAVISMLAVTVTGIGALFSAYLHMVILFIIGYVLGHLLYGMFPVVIASISSAAHNDKRKLLWVGLLQFFTGLAFVIGPFVGSVIMAQSNSFISPYYVITAISIILIFIIWCCYKPERYYQQQKVRKNIPLMQTLWRLVKQRKIAILIVLLLLDQLAWGMYFQFIQPIAKLKLGFNVAQIGILVSFIGLSLMISALILLPILQRFLSYQTLFITAILAMLVGALGAMLLALYPTDHQLLVYVVSFFMAFGDMVVFSLLVVGFSNAVEIHYQGFISGFLYTLAKGFGWGVSGVLGGVFMTINMAWSMGFASLCLLVLLIIFIKNHQVIYDNDNH
ncbi:MFS transporter [Cysteiniphilum litorale]|uniref:MFS transporter n=1 Tax=Cysteiniphilum litorale TaxID=2056700 RepID=UPI003F885DC2